MSEPETRWIMVRQNPESHPVAFEVVDTMHCIEAPGDYGWVRSVGKFANAISLIVFFEQLHPSEFKAREAAIKEIKADIDRLMIQYEALRWLNDK